MNPVSRLNDPTILRVFQSVPPQYQERFQEQILQEEEFNHILKNMTEKEKDLCKVLKAHFKQIRQIQNQGHDPNITTDVLFILKATYQTLIYAVDFLKEIGIIITQRYIVLNEDKIINLLYIKPKNRLKILLPHERWEKVVKESEITEFSKIFLNKNDFKNWTIYTFPNDTDLSRFILSTPRIYANNPNNLKDPKHQQNQNSSYFPLVSIQYERSINNNEIVDLPPTKPIRPKPNLQYVALASYQLRVNPKV